MVLLKGEMHCGKPYSIALIAGRSSGNQLMIEGDLERLVIVK